MDGQIRTERGCLDANFTTTRTINGPLKGRLADKLCHRSKAWVCLFVRALFSGFVSKKSKTKGNRKDHRSPRFPYVLHSSKGAQARAQNHWACRSPRKLNPEGPNSTSLGRSRNGYGSKLNHQGTADFSPCFHLPGFHFGYLCLTHSQITFASSGPSSTMKATDCSLREFARTGWNLWRCGW